MPNNLAVVIDDFDLTFNYPDEYEPANPNIEHFINVIKKVNKIPFNKGNMCYSDMIWDFAPYTTLNIAKKNLKFKFSLCCDTFRDDLKNYVLLQILENNSKIQTTHKEFRTLYQFFNHAEKNGFFDVQDITDQEIKDFLATYEESSLVTKLWNKTVLKKYYSFYAANFKDLLTEDRKKIFENDNIRATYAHKENMKMKDIPKEYFDKFLAGCVKVADDTSEPKFIRGVACMYIIMSQTGLRIGECLGLTVDSLETVKIFNGEETHYMTYKTWKREKGNNGYSIQKTYINELSKKAFETLVAIYDEDRKETGVNYLYLGGSYTIKNKNYPIDPNTYNKTQRIFATSLNKHFQVFDLPDNAYPEIDRANITSDYHIATYLPGKSTLALPKNHQFRVHVCTELYNKGVPLKYIQKFMSHLSCEMEGYYVRPTKQNPQENMDFTLDTLKKIVTGETKLLGGHASLMDKINEFIKENHYNVETDLTTICEKLAKKIPVRQKTGGVCIKSSMLRECSNDAQTNEFYCAYGVCPNIFHFYYMADVSYRQAKELTETIKINEERGLMRQVEKEQHMLWSIVKKKLIPELEELKNVINKKGVTAVITEYPDLAHIIENMNEIEKEVAVWSNLK